MVPLTDTVLDELRETRARTFALEERIDERLAETPAAPHLGPIRWDLGHIAWFEELWLLRRVGGREPVDGRLDAVYDAFEQPRAVRRRLALPTRRQTLRYMNQIRERSLDVISRLSADSDDSLIRDGYAVRMVIQDEIQHQDTILQSLDLAGGPSPRSVIRGLTGAHPTADDRRLAIPGGAYAIGSSGWGGTYDNERPRHSCDIAAFSIDRFPVTNRRFLEFVRDDGYARADLWTREGWHWRCSAGVEWPQNWRTGDGREFVVGRFDRIEPLAVEEPVQHVSFHEAQAFARWAGGRLPTEHEWEAAVCSGRHERLDVTADAPDANADKGASPLWDRDGPEPIAGVGDAEESPGRELIRPGGVYEWTASLFAPYPGFRAFPYRDYSEPFFDGRYRVLRGASWAVSEPLVRATYRNWDLPRQRQIFAGFRLAWN